MEKHMTIETTATFTSTLLAKELGITSRRVRQLEAEGVLRRLPDGRFDPEESDAAYNAFRAGRGSAAMRRVYADAENLSLEIERDLARLAKRPQAERLDAAMNGVGPKIGRLVHLLSLAAATAPDDRREFERQHVAMLQSQIIGSMLSTIGVQLEPGEAA